MMILMYMLRLHSLHSINQSVNQSINHSVSHSNRGHTNVHYSDVIMGSMASQITSLSIVYSTVYSRCRSKKISKLCVTGLCWGNSPVTGQLPREMASNVENISIWWRHHVTLEVPRHKVWSSCSFGMMRVWFTPLQIHKYTHLGLFTHQCNDAFVLTGCMNFMVLLSSWTLVQCCKKRLYCQLDQSLV